MGLYGYFSAASDTVADDILSGAENDGTWGMGEDEYREFCENELDARMGIARRRARPAPAATIFWESRYVLHDCAAGPWGPLPEVKAPTREALVAYLATLYGREPVLCATWNADVLDDGRYQYRLRTAAIC